MDKSNQHYEVDEVGDRLKAYPQIAERLNQLLDLMENRSGTMIKADDIEIALIPELRGLGKDMLGHWGTQREREERAAAEEEGLKHHSKKKSIGIQL